MHGPKREGGGVDGLPTPRSGNASFHLRSYYTVEQGEDEGKAVKRNNKNSIKETVLKFDRGITYFGKTQHILCWSSLKRSIISYLRCIHAECRQMAKRKTS